MLFLQAWRGTPLGLWMRFSVDMMPHLQNTKAFKHSLRSFLVLSKEQMWTAKPQIPKPMQEFGQ
jgi:hypothetical protein